MLKRFGVSLEEDLLKELDHFVLEKGFPNRSQAIRHLVKNNRVEENWEENKEVAGAIVLVYDHHISDLQNRSTEIQHEYYEAILSVQHVHLDHHNCIETIAVKGKAKVLQKLADKLITMKGIQHGKLIMSGML